jgi:Flp pilus assembly protein TadB
MGWLTLVAAALAAMAATLWWRPAPPRPRPPPLPCPSSRQDWVQRGRVLWSACGLVAGLLLWPGWGGVALGVAAAVVVNRLVAGAEPAERRRERAAVRADLPLLVLFLASALRAGAATSSAVRQAAAALPGPGAERLLVAADRLAMGVAPDRVWSELATDAELGAVGRALARAERTGAPVAAVVERLADDLADAGRAEVEDRARAVGVRAAVPLGVCLLPSFLLLGIVPLVASLVAGLRL